MLTGVRGDDAVMREEIFGPVLPIVEVDGLDEAIAFINDRDKPLALYGFTENREPPAAGSPPDLVRRPRFGLPMAHLRVPDLPFGGVGESGTRQLPRPHSIAAFSHRRARLDVPLADCCRAGRAGRESGRSPSVIAQLVEYGDGIRVTSGVESDVRSADQLLALRGPRRQSDRGVGDE
ncbi:aldehyde dehydrogenase family protein [Streptomyces sp. KL116D]|uniref:aldehyde dehydrogenase family protein n=1 Tax=Streptomyces sp. KL116D TaxID=3045152 RepID=UPI003558EECE